MKSYASLLQIRLVLWTVRRSKRRVAFQLMTTLREVKSNIVNAQLQQKEAHREAEELQDEHLHGVPDVEHKMKKVNPSSPTLRC